MSESVTVLILAAGKQTRWQKSGAVGLKQFTEVDGEPIIHRTFRMLTDRGHDPLTVVRDPANRAWQGLNPVEAAHEDWMGEMGKFLDHRPYWPEQGRVVGVYGDVFYTDATLDVILDHDPDQPTIYGRALSQKHHRRSESFGLSFRVPEDVDEVERVAKAVAGVKGMNRRGGPWRFFWHRHTGGLTYTRSERRKLTGLATRENGWVETPVDETDDFDQVQDLWAWRKEFGRA